MHILALANYLGSYVSIKMFVSIKSEKYSIKIKMFSLKKSYLDEMQ